MAMINIFGDWQGNVAFGQPDLWLAGSAVTSPAPALPGGLINYALSYTNNGDADATDVVITDDFDPRLVSIVNPGGGTITAPGSISWNIGTVSIGQTAIINYQAAINDNISEPKTYIQNTATIESLEEDANSEDNTDTLSVQVDQSNVYGARRRPYVPYAGYPHIQADKTNDVEDYVVPGDIVNYKIVLENYGDGSAYDVVVYDTLTNEQAEIIETFNWDLGRVYPNEEIIIEYSLAINEGIEAGLYTNTVTMEGKTPEGAPLTISRGQRNSVIEVQVPEILPEPEEEIEEILEEEPEEIVEEEPQPETFEEKLIGIIGQVNPLNVSEEAEAASLIEESVEIQRGLLASTKVNGKQPKYFSEYFAAGLANLLSLRAFWVVFLILMIALLILIVLIGRQHHY